MTVFHEAGMITMAPGAYFLPALREPGPPPAPKNPGSLLFELLLWALGPHRPVRGSSAHSNPILERIVLGSDLDRCKYMTVVLETVWPRIA